jgi:hypothetical protein
MNHKLFLYIGIFTLCYGIFLKNEKQDLICVKSIVKNVKRKDTVINNINGLEISEIQSNADVIYKLGDDVYETNINVTKNQPVQVGNVIDIQYNQNEVKRKEKGIPHYKYWISYSIIMLSFSLFTFKYPNLFSFKDSTDQ